MKLLMGKFFGKAKLMLKKFTSLIKKLNLCLNLYQEKS